MKAAPERNQTHTGQVFVVQLMIYSGILMVYFKNKNVKYATYKTINVKQVLRISI